MASAQSAPLLHYLRRLAARQAGAGLSDADLLDRYGRLGDEEAFAVLVRRHGPLVFAACRRVLDNSHDAEDCFQAAFLLLARNARSRTMPRSLGPWLYGVALRTARKARGKAAQRRRLEARAARSPVVRSSDEGTWCDLRPVLDEAVGRLPEKYRTAFVLCCLQGVTVSEAAGQLGCPRGTVAARLARAKERLHSRLARQGVALGAALSVTLTAKAMAAEVPAALLSSTVKAAGLFAAGGAVGAGGIPGHAALKGMVQAVFANKIRSVAALLLLLAAVAGAVRGRPAPTPRVESSRASAEETSRSAPAATLELGGKARFLSLAEASALALKHRAARLGVARLSLERGDAKTEREVNQVLVSVETAYWYLYGAYWGLHSREQGLRLAHQTWKEVGDNYRAGRAGLADFAQAHGQYELFRAQRLQSLDQVFNYERQLRSLLGLPAWDGPFLVPRDAPSLAAAPPDWAASLREALANRPELRLARNDPAFPDRELRDQERKVEHFLALQYRKWGLTYEQIKANRAQREAFATQLKTRNRQYLAGRGTLDILLEAQRFWADALAQEYAAIAAHNNAQVAFAFGKGAIRQRATKEEDGATRAPTLVTLWESVVPLEDVQPLPPLDTPPVETPPVETPHSAKDPPLTPWKVEDLFPGGTTDRQQRSVPRRLP